MTATRLRADAHRLLLRALLARADGAATIGNSRSEAWASATFRGARHRFALQLSGPEAAARGARLAQEIDGIEFDLAGHLVADIAVTAQAQDGDTVTLAIEALSVEDA